jgi:hypothetical protein
MVVHISAVNAHVKVAPENYSIISPKTRVFLLRQNLLHQFPLDIRQPEVSALESIRELRMIEA